MRIVKRTEFLTLPAGTLYSSYEPCCFGDLLIKGATLSNNNDWLCQQITGGIDCTSSDEFGDLLEESRLTGASIAMDFDCQGRDGAFEPDDTLYAVWEREDVEKLIKRLQLTVTE